MNDCPICGKPLEGKQQYCGPACRKKASRQKDEPELPKALKDPAEPLPSTARSNPSEDPSSGKPSTKSTSNGLTPTDLSFEAWNPGFYRFSEDNFYKVCNTCGMKFNSHLEMTRFCSPDCRDLLLRRLTGIKDEPERTRKR